MSNTNPFPPHESFQPSSQGIHMLTAMAGDLELNSPYRRYPPFGVPCPLGPNTFHLALRREKWCRMLDHLAPEERVCLHRLDVAEQSRRRDSVGPATRDPKVEEARQEDASSVTTLTEEAIYEIEPEEEQGPHNETMDEAKDADVKQNKQNRSPRPPTCDAAAKQPVPPKAKSRSKAAAKTKTTKRSHLEANPTVQNKENTLKASSK